MRSSGKTFINKIAGFLLVIMLLSPVSGAFAQWESNTTGTDDPPWYRYTDPDTGISFLMQDEWMQVDFNTDNEVLKTKFKKDSEDSEIIMYGAVDMYIATSSYLLIEREDLNMDLMYGDLWDMAKAAASSEEDYGSEVIGGRAYVYVRVTSKTQIFGIEYETVLLTYYTVDNGYLICMQFSGDRDNSSFKDFLSALRSLETGV